MTFYKLEHSVDPLEIGVFDQIQKFKVVPGSLEPNAFMNIDLEGELEPAKSFPQLFLEKRAKWTDFLHLVPGAGNFLLISPKVLSVMHRHEMDNYQTFEVEVVRGQETYVYYLLRFPWSRNRDYIDWERSVFGHTTYMWRELIAEMQFKNYEDYYAFNKPPFRKDGYVIVRKIFFREDVIEKDIFRLLFISSGVYVSESLKDALQKEGITGCRFVALGDLGERVTKENYPNMVWPSPK
ncbi:MAG: imm11 family protein [Saprospiraceae bacterium]